MSDDRNSNMGPIEPLSDVWKRLNEGCPGGPMTREELVEDMRCLFKNGLFDEQDLEKLLAAFEKDGEEIAALRAENEGLRGKYQGLALEMKLYFSDSISRSRLEKAIQGALKDG